MDYKDWIQNKADEIAVDRYGLDFYSLPGSLQITVFNEAESHYKDYLASTMDRARDLVKYGR